MTVRRLLLSALLPATALAALTGCGIRPTDVPVDAGAPASRTACPNPVQVPNAPAVSSPAPSPAASLSPSAVPSAVPSAKVTAAPASPPPSLTPTGVFGAPSSTRCPG
ncbi:hypothetical protein AB0K51_20600 [Kitasatospora sp. NPDC049285]|uniref:hypothetical protein n=1 Tax=Kitasatospora sp. NPDC049285 TaxID=3157096 RepID=UPI00343895C6